MTQRISLHTLFTVKSKLKEKWFLAHKMSNNSLKQQKKHCQGSPMHLLAFIVPVVCTEQVCRTRSKFVQSPLKIQSDHSTKTRESKRSGENSDIFTLTCNQFPQFLMLHIYIAKRLVLYPNRIKTSKMQYNKSVRTFHEEIVSYHFSPPHNYRGRCSVFSLLDMPTNLHVRLWELVAKISADTLSFRNSFFTISTAGLFGPVLLPYLNDDKELCFLK